MRVAKSRESTQVRNPARDNRINCLAKLLSGDAGVVKRA